MKMGLQVIYQPRFDADRWLRVVEEQRPMASSFSSRPWPIC